MFFCHAIEVQRNELLKKGKDVSGFPIVKCFERAPGPGGVWRADRSHEDEDQIDEQKGASSDAMNLVVPCFGEEKKEDDSIMAQETPASPTLEAREAKKMKLDEVGQGSSVEASASGTAVKHVSTNMYSALWTNGVKEAFEFSDYTFKDHFGDVRMPTFLPRKHILDYILTRCTKNCPNFFDKYFSFRTSVVNVKYENNSSVHSVDNKFCVHTRNEATGIEETKTFDKCIWAGGMNGIPNIPTKLINAFKDGGFKGSLVHSSNTTNFKSDVHNKRVLIVGGGYSAEDLAIMAIKEGVSQIYCTWRGDDEKEMSWTTRWPYDKVETYPRTTVVKVEGNTVTLGEVYPDFDKGYLLVKDGEGERTVVNDIDTVIFCTGYEANVNMLDPLLADAYNGNDDSDGEVKMPKDWKMHADTAIEAILGKDKHVKPSKIVFPNDNFQNCYYDLHRGSILIKNPNMMYMLNDFSDSPLMEVDITAWMLATYVTGQKIMPSADEMEEENYRTSLDCMQIPQVRYSMDHRFHKAINKATDDFDGMSEEQEKIWLASEIEGLELQFRLLGKMMNEGEYPVRLLLGDGKTFNEYGKKVKLLNQLCPREHMHEIKYDDISEDNNSADAGKHTLRTGWMTFRDSPDIDEYVSPFTGIKACGLPKPWFELNEDDKLWQLTKTQVGHVGRIVVQRRLVGHLRMIACMVMDNDLIATMFDVRDPWSNVATSS